ncbi:hypothetical protein LZ30DRAFT_727402 [Colletotrichum cereale]|nr:hypothetical protein LZ30DRAFT_727402 [Colletotrichum cereale]
MYITLDQGCTHSYSYCFWECFQDERAMIVPRLFTQRPIGKACLFTLFFSVSCFLVIYYLPDLLPERLQRQPYPVGGQQPSPNHRHSHRHDLFRGLHQRHRPRHPRHARERRHRYDRVRTTVHPRCRYQHGKLGRLPDPWGCCLGHGMAAADYRRPG